MNAPYYAKCPRKPNFQYESFDFWLVPYLTRIGIDKFESGDKYSKTTQGRIASKNTILIVCNWRPSLRCLAKLNELHGTFTSWPNRSDWKRVLTACSGFGRLLVNYVCRNSLINIRMFILFRRDGSGLINIWVFAIDWEDNNKCKMYWFLSVK